MGFFSRKKKKTEEASEQQADKAIIETEDVDVVLEEPEQDGLIIDDAAKRKQYVENCCEQIVEAEKRVEEFKVEYQLVNAYLSDIQIIDSLPENKKHELVEQAKRIIVFSSDREEYSRVPEKLTYKQRVYLDEHADELGDIIKSLAEDEEYCRAVRMDMKYLEGEKMGLRMERKELKERIRSLGGIAKLGVLSIFALVIILLLYNNATGNSIDMMLYAVVAAGIVMTAVIFVLHRKTLYDIRYTEVRINRAIALLNKVKLKYVNVASRLEYAYEKHGVKSAVQLSKMWNIYLKDIKRREVYQRTSDKLSDSEERLVKLLSEVHVKDPEVWVSQATTIIEESEMVELKRNIEKRREKIKTALDYNMNAIEKSKYAIRELIDNNRKYAKEIMEIVDKFEKQ